jgi:phage terminase large subunit
MVTKDSLNLIKELRNFRYIEDKKGILTSKTTHTFSHALDATRYAVAGKTEIKAIPKLWFVNTGEE